MISFAIYNALTHSSQPENPFMYLGLNVLSMSVDLIATSWISNYQIEGGNDRFNLAFIVYNVSIVGAVEAVLIGANTIQRF